MFKRLKQFFEKIAYAGLKPEGGRPAQKSPAASTPEAAKAKGPGGFRAWVESKLTKAGPADPLYLSNRTTGQKVKTGVMIAIPVAIILGSVGLVLSGVFRSEKPIVLPPAMPSSAEQLPNLNLHIDSQHDLDIDDVHVVPGSPAHLAGLVKNETDHAIAKAELVFDLTDKTGSRQGAVSTELKNIAPKSTAPFDFPIEQTTASFALVREIRVQ